MLFNSLSKKKNTKASNMDLKVVKKNGESQNADFSRQKQLTQDNQHIINFFNLNNSLLS